MSWRSQVTFVGAEIIWWSYAKYRIFFGLWCSTAEIFLAHVMAILEGAETTISFCLSCITEGVGLIEIVQYTDCADLCSHWRYLKFTRFADKCNHQLTLLNILYYYNWMFIDLEIFDQKKFKRKTFRVRDFLAVMHDWTSGRNSTVVHQSSCAVPPRLKFTFATVCHYGLE